MKPILIALAFVATSAIAAPPGYVRVTQGNGWTFYANPASRHVYRNNDSPGSFITTMDEYADTPNGPSSLRSGYNCAQPGVALEIVVENGVLAYGAPYIFNEGTTGMATWRFACNVTPPQRTTY